MYFLAFKYFEKLAVELNFTRAAEKLFISQQNLSQHIKRLEKYYQVELFERKPELKLTYAGEQLLAFAKQLASGEERLTADLSFIRKNEKGRLALGITTSRSPIFLPKLLSRYKRQHPNIALSLRESNTSQLEQFLRGGEIDVAVGVRSNDKLTDGDFKIVELLQDRHLFMLATDALLEQYIPNFRRDREAYVRGIRICDFTQVPVIMNTEASRIHQEIGQYYRDLGAKPNVLIESNNSGISLLPLCAQGIVAIFTPQIQLFHMLNQHPDLKERVNILPIRDLLLENTIVLMHMKGKAISKFASDLIEMTKEVFAEIRDDLAEMAV